MAARFFLGVGEAAIAPGFSLITGMFYKREEQPARYLHIILFDVAQLIGKLTCSQSISLVLWQLYLDSRRRCCLLGHRQYQVQHCHQLAASFPRSGSYHVWYWLLPSSSTP